MNPKIINLESGYLRIVFGPQQWAQIPRGFVGDTIPDEFIFDPNWNRKIVNSWWNERNEAIK